MLPPSPPLATPPPSRLFGGAFVTWYDLPEALWTCASREAMVATCQMARLSTMIAHVNAHFTVPARTPIHTRAQAHIHACTHTITQTNTRARVHTPARTCAHTRISTAVAELVALTHRPVILSSSTWSSTSRHSTLDTLSLLFTSSASSIFACSTVRGIPSKMNPFCSQVRAQAQEHVSILCEWPKGRGGGGG